MKKKILVLSVSFLVLFTAACGKKTSGNINTEPDVHEINEENVIGEQTIDGILFKDASFTVVNGITEFRVTLENTITTVRRITSLKVTFKDEFGIVLQTLNYYDFDTLRKGDTQDLTWNLNEDFKEIKKVEYEIEM